MKSHVISAVFTLILLTSNVNGFFTPQFCSGANITNESKVDPEELLGKVWYLHLVIDDLLKFDQDSKIIYTVGSRKTDLFAYQTGKRALTGQCNTILIQDAQLIRNRPCIMSKVLFPATNEEAVEYVQAYVDDNSQLIFYECYDYDLRRQECKRAGVLGATTRTSFSSREKAAFERKIKQLTNSNRIPGTLRLDNPSSNNCEQEIATELGIGTTLKRYRY